MLGGRVGKEEVYFDTAGVMFDFSVRSGGRMVVLSAEVMRSDDEEEEAAVRRVAIVLALCAV